jgi:hypothetical protein
VLCNCDNLEACRMERYVSDVRILMAEMRSFVEGVQERLQGVEAATAVLRSYVTT